MSEFFDPRIQFAIAEHAPKALQADKFQLPWEDVADFFVWGNICPENLKTFEHQAGKVAILGNCFTDNKTLESVAMKAFELDQPELLTYFPGAYTTIFRTDTSTTVMRAVTGVQPVFYRRDGGSPIVSSDPVIVAPPGPLEIDADLVTANLLIPCAAEGQIFGNQTAFTGVSKLMGSQALRLDYRTRSFHHYTYESLSSDPSVPVTTAGNKLRAALEESMRGRVKTGKKLSANLSGGLDSTALVAVTLSQSPSDMTLPVFFMTNPDTADGNDAYFWRYVNAEPRLKPHLFDPRRRWKIP